MIRCSESAREEPLAGTAPFRRYWWVIEHPGPWPARPIQESVLGESASWVMPLNERTDTAVLLSRQRDPHRPRRVWRADTLRQTLVTGLCGPSRPVLGSSDEDLTLVCTHARRDQCCALFGRPLLTVIDGARESTHIGGHRFAPTVLLLPSGILLGRCGPAEWPAVGSLGPEAVPYYRGRTSLDGPAQVADAEARRIWGLGLLHDVSIERMTEASPHRFRVSCAGRSCEIAVESSETACVASCGKDPEPHTVWRVSQRS